MSKLLINVSLFCLGLLLSVGFVHVSNSLKQSRQNSEISLSGVQMPSTRLSGQQLSERRQTGALRRAVSERRLRMLENALHGETLHDFDLLKQDDLRALSNYRSVILPRLKLRTFEILLRRFTESDWRTWPIGALDRNRNPTNARRFVDMLWQVNSDIASFAETTAYLLHGMFLSIANGKPYPIRQDLQYLVMNTDDMLSARQSAAKQRESAFDATILQYPAIYLSFERVRGELTKQFIREHPFQRESHFSLLLDLDPRVYDASLRNSLKEALQNLSLNASGGYRAEILPAVVDSRLFTLLATEDNGIAKSLAQLYLVGAVDAIEAGRLELAQRLLLRSESTYGGLEAQKVLASFIEEQEHMQQTSEKVTPSEVKSTPELVVRTSSDSEAAEGASIGWVTLALLAALGVAVIYGIRIFSERRSTTLVSKGIRSTGTSTTKEKKPRSILSDPGSLDFGDDPLDADIDFDLPQTANR